LTETETVFDRDPVVCADGFVTHAPALVVWLTSCVRDSGYVFHSSHVPESTVSVSVTVSAILPRHAKQYGEENAIG
jgi:hypothetical protein